MANNKLSTPKGTRDFSPEQMIKRNYIFSVIEKVFQHYGFMPVETPAMENLSTLMGKCGKEEDKLIFKILNSGNYLSKTNDKDLQNISLSKLSSDICEKGLIYDLTVPFARYVAQHRNDIIFPFKRYQIQPVWRADKPQKGRYREFYQCDVDIIGSNSLLNELELIQIIDDIFKDFNFNIVIKINNRKILAGIADAIGETDKFNDITVAIDKLEKIGSENVSNELIEKGISQDAINKLLPIINLSDSSVEKINKLKHFLKNSEIGLKGIEEAETIFDYLKYVNIKYEVELDLTLARGLNYYTGTIFEVKSKDVKMGSICGGGRYDDLTGIFGLKNVSGVGISFGADRIYDILNELNLFPDTTNITTQVLFVNFGEQEERYCLPLLAKVRKAGINAEIYPSSDKIKKQMSYADRKNIPYVVLIGKEEIDSNLLTVRNMDNGKQQKLNVDELINYLSKS
jgi:histidyl-tRNA synthetase